MSSKKGFTLVELMVVILIVAILAAVAIPIMRGRIDAAKWSEGKAMMGTVATAIRAYCAELDVANANLENLDFEKDLGFQSGDLTGTYFTDQNKFTILKGDYDPSTNALNFVIRAEAPAAINAPKGFTLDQAGVWESLELVM